MPLHFRIQSILRQDALRWHVLGVVQALDLPDCWIGAGFVRNAVWDSLHGNASSPLTSDVDVIWFDAGFADAALDRKHEAALRRIEPRIAWSVKNQARMHVRNGDAPYASAVDAMRYWPETATAIAARRYGPEGCEIAAPLGCDDLMDMVLRPAGCFRAEKRSLYDERLRTKDWMASWPLLRMAEE